MNFLQNQTIYLQIAQNMMENVLRDTWKEGERIPSVRDLAATLAVNPNTIVRSYAFLEGKEIISNQRGIGYFLTPGAKQRVIVYRKEVFMNKDLPRMFTEMELLGLSLDDISKELNTHKTRTCIFLATLLAAEIPIIVPMAYMRYGKDQNKLKEKIENVQNGSDRRLEAWSADFDSTVIKKDTHDPNLVFGVKDDVYRISGITSAGVAGDGGWRNEGINRSCPPCKGDVVLSGEFRMPRTGESGVVFLGTNGACLMRDWGHSAAPFGNRYVIQTQAEKEQGKLFRLVKGSMSRTFMEKDTSRYTKLSLRISEDRHHVTYFVNGQLLGELHFKDRIYVGRTLALALQTPQVKRYQEIYFRNLNATCNGQTVLLREDIPENQRLFDFSTQIFCGLEFGADIATATTVFGKPAIIDSTIWAGSVPRYDKRYVYKDLEVHCVNNKIVKIVSNSPYMVTNRGLRKEDSRQTLKSLYGEYLVSVTGDTSSQLRLGDLCLTAILRDNKVERFELVKATSESTVLEPIVVKKEDLLALDFDRQLFCGLRMGADIATALTVQGKPVDDSAPIAEGYAGRYDKRLVFTNLEIYCWRNRIGNIVTWSPDVVTDKGLRNGDSLATLIDLYGEPQEIINDGAGYLYALGRFNLNVIVHNKRVDGFEMCAIVSDDELKNQRVFDFCSQTFCGLSLGTDIATAISIHGPPGKENTTVRGGYVGRYDKKWVFDGIEIYSRQGRIADIVTWPLQIVTNRVFGKAIRRRD